MGLESNEWCPYKKRRRETMQERRPCEDRGRDWNDVVISQGMPRSHKKPAREGFFLEPPEGARPCQYLHFRLLASRAVIINALF